MFIHEATPIISFTTIRNNNPNKILSEVHGEKPRKAGQSHVKVIALKVIRISF